MSESKTLTEIVACHGHRTPVLVVCMLILCITGCDEGVPPGVPGPTDKAAVHGAALKVIQADQVVAGLLDGLQTRRNWNANGRDLYEPEVSIMVQHDGQTVRLDAWPTGAFERDTSESAMVRVNGGKYLYELSQEEYRWFLRANRPTSGGTCRITHVVEGFTPTEMQLLYDLAGGWYQVKALPTDVPIAVFICQADESIDRRSLPRCLLPPGPI